MSWLMLETVFPLNSVITLFDFSPALSAAPPSVTFDTNTPAGIPYIWTASELTDEPTIPSTPCSESSSLSLEVSFIRFWRISVTSEIAIAYPIPSTSVDASFAELIPTTSPSIFKRAPPLLPGLIAASVWIRFTPSLLSSLPSVTVLFSESILRFLALTIPVVTDCPYPRALPIVTTCSPTLRSSELPIFATEIASIVSSLISSSATDTTARSLSSSKPFTDASTAFPSANATDNVSAFSTTW